MILPLVEAGSRLCVVLGVSGVLIYSCRRLESDSTPARNEAIILTIRMSISVNTITYLAETRSCKIYLYLWTIHTKRSKF
jgi:hypothetical protein